MKIKDEDASMKYHTESRCKLTGDYCHFSTQGVGCVDCRQCNVPIIMAIVKLAGKEGTK